MALLFYRIAFTLLLLAPLYVYWLPNFQTTVEEDFLLLGLFLYMLLRLFNPQRKILSEPQQQVLIFGIFGVLYVVGWLGLLRGYLAEEGRLLILYPALLLAAVFIAPKAFLKKNHSYQNLIQLLLAFTILVFLLSTIAWLSAMRPLPQSTKSLIAPLIALPILSCVSLFSRSVGQLNNLSGNVVLFLAVTACAAMPWYENANTYAYWFQAGELERSWTPYKFEDPQKIAEAQKKPLEAAIYYQITYSRILEKGEIPHYLNWPFFLRYRMAYQALRLENPPLCAGYLPPSYSKNDSKIELLKNLWHTEFMNRTLEHPPRYEQDELVWMDFEIDAEGQVFALDRWGRVYQRMNGVFINEWKADETLTDAIDLELGNGFYVLRKTGEIVSSATVIEFDLKQKPMSGTPVDFELSPNNQTAFLISSYGDVRISGATPAVFPDPNELLFTREVIADFELDPDGKGYYLLDQYGALHANHVDNSPSLPYKSPAIANESLPYWLGQNRAKDLEIDTYHGVLFVYTRFGELFCISPNPFMEEYLPEISWPYRGVVTKVRKDGSVRVFQSNGQEIVIDLESE